MSQTMQGLVRSDRSGKTRIGFKQGSYFSWQLLINIHYCVLSITELYIYILHLVWYYTALRLNLASGDFHVPFQTICCLSLVLTVLTTLGNPHGSGPKSGCEGSHQPVP